MHSALNYKVNTLLATNPGMITSIEGQEVLIKFDSHNCLIYYLLIHKDATHIIFPY